MVKEFYQALTDKNIKALKTMIHPNLFGVRLYDESLYYERKTFLNAIDDLDYSNIEIVDIVNDDFLIVTLKKDEYILKTKITIKDSLIYKIYETVTSEARRIKCIIGYDGSSYLGYQKQNNASTIQGTFEEALKRCFKQDMIIHSSGRTDKGVHANNQVVHFDTKMNIPLYNMKKLINSYLPDSIYIKSMEEVTELFHSRYDVTKKTYCYKINTLEYNPIYRNYEWFVENLDEVVFEKHLEDLLGTHDFASFTKSTTKNTLRTIYDIEVIRKDEYIYTYITGNGFLRYMVRNIIGAAVHMTLGTISYTMDDLLEKKDVNLLKDKAPACGLYLDRVVYDNL